LLKQDFGRNDNGGIGAAEGVRLLCRSDVIRTPRNDEILPPLIFACKAAKILEDSGVSANAPTFHSK
jgi:hypothetical protein